ncbi:MAG: hypothetical protein GY862_14185 [Gammaproteobacteria bacterium]|nr:hypothetical protein [Gammaproteobacteria bacterium]
MLKISEKIPPVMPAAAFFLFFSACSSVSTLPTERLEIGPDPGAPQCVKLFSLLDQAVDKTGVGDAQAAPVPGFPYLRANRFLTSFRGQKLSSAEFDAWADRLQQLGEQGRKAEMANLPPEARQLFPPYETVQQCGDLLRQNDFSQEYKRPHKRRKLMETVSVPQEYQTWKRILGLYWLTAWPVKLGAHNLYKEIRETYRTPLEKLKVKGELIRYLPPALPDPLNAREIKEILHSSAANPLKIPEPQGRERERLFAAFAPVWQVDARSKDDRIGAPVWLPSRDKPSVDTHRPAVYRYLSHTRFRGDVLLQLNYVVWFPARPTSSGIDLLGGHIDGLTWRVTLSADGTPLAYDTIHNCGCYHWFYPASRLHVRPAEGILQEPPFSPQQAPEPLPGRGLALRIAHTSHFIDRVLQKTMMKEGQTLAYEWADYRSLRSLPLANGQRRSLFQPDGIVPGTERGERWVLWPMGIPGPGEMRQRGHHATAFFGRRHFDDPDLMERSFIMKAKE